MDKLMDIIHDLIACIKAQGIDVPDTAARNIEASIRQSYAGERVYVRGAPKLRRQVQVRIAQQTLGTAASIEAIHRMTGLPTRTIKRIKNGR